MQRPSKPALRFVRALLPDGMGKREGEAFAVERDGRKLALAASEVRELVRWGWSTPIGQGVVPIAAPRSG